MRQISTLTQNVNSRGKFSPVLFISSFPVTSSILLCFTKEFSVSAPYFPCVVCDIGGKICILKFVNVF